MATKITLANGTVIEYQGDIAIAADGSVVLEGKTPEPVYVAAVPFPETEAPVLDLDDEDSLVYEMLAPRVSRSFKLRMIDAMINVNNVYFETFSLMCVNRRAVPERDASKIADLHENVSSAAAAARVYVLLDVELVERCDRGRYTITDEVYDIFCEHRDAIEAERARRSNLRNGARVRHTSDSD